MRVILINLFLLLLPLMLFIVYAWLTNRRARKGGLLTDAPLISLAIAGVLLVLAMVAYFISFDSAPPGGKYTPPSFENGTLRPGEIRPRED
ncbi:MAG: hypothetical protein GC150_07170 [Rhizobiales bacterium]|nr:hypothetical protein [Hyphomicrobiales bacterium]